MADLKLKPCPFCGGEPIHKNIGEHRNYVICTNECYVIPSTALCRTPEEAAEAWNARATEERTCRNNYWYGDATRFWCSECDFKSNWPISNGKAAKPNYCPNCGAKVVG